MRTRIALVSALLVATLAPRLSARLPQFPDGFDCRVEAIAPVAARIGERVTITGHGFGAHNVRVTVGGVQATVVAANGHRVTLIVPPGVPPGPTTVIVRNPGRRSASIAFTVLGGSSGPPASGPPAIVSQESARASSAMISETGGVVTATATNGTVYTLSIPPGAVLTETLITITPIATTVPFSGASIAVRLQPSGLRLHRPAMLEIIPGAGTAVTPAASMRATQSRLARWRLFLRWLRERHRHPQPPPNPPPPDPGTPTDRTLGFIFDDAGTNFEVLPVVADGTTLAIEVEHFSAAGTAGVTAADFAASMQPLINTLPSTLPPTQVASLISSLVSWLQPPGPGFDLCTGSPICQQVFQIATDSLLAHRDQACSVTQSFVQSGEPFLAREALSRVALIGARLLELGGLAEEAGVPGFEQTFDFACIAESLNSIVDLARDQILDNPRGGLLVLLSELASDAQLLDLGDQMEYAVTAMRDVLNLLLERAIGQCLLDADVAVGESLIDLIKLVFPDTFLDGIDAGLAGRFGTAYAECRIRIEPAATNVGAGQPVQFTATAVGLTPSDVTWSVNGGGSIDPQSGVFTAGQELGTFTVTATSVVASPARSKTASVTVVDVSVSIIAQSFTIAAGGTRQFSVIVNGLSNVDVVWTATRGTIDPQTGFFTAPATAGPVTIRATSVVAPVFDEVVVTVVAGGTITSLSHPTFIGACSSADLQVFTSGFANPAMTFTVQGPGTLRNQTLIGTTTFTTWRANNTATGEIVITARSVQNPNVTRTATLLVDRFVAAYGGGVDGSAFVVRGVDAGLPDDTYRLALSASGGASGIYIAQVGAGGLVGTAANGNTISVSISSSLMEGTVNVVGGPSVDIILSHNCAGQ
jgi:hypothetical protein